MAMAGRSKQQVFKYNSVGKFLAHYESVAEYRKDNYKEDKSFTRPLFEKSEQGLCYDIRTDIREIAFKVRAGRRKAIAIFRIHHSIYCKDIDQRDNVAIEVVNLRGEVIAEFKNQRLLLALMPHISPASLFYQLDKSKHKNKTNESGLSFRQKETAELKIN